MRPTNWLRPACTLIILCAITSALSAQPQPPSGPVRSPTFSPYLNLLARGTNPAVNYFGIIRPYQQLRHQTDQLQKEILLANQSMATGFDNNNDLDVRRSATFGNYSHFYHNDPAASHGTVRPAGSDHSGRASLTGISVGGGIAKVLAPTEPGRMQKGRLRPAGRN